MNKNNEYSKNSYLCLDILEIILTYEFMLNHTLEAKL